ncbi:hypothetical protein ACI2K4_11100 [Micromonospora sp. NPDC050397]|uniref:hypothetical protein n=1 Tax=Micromonospora sp. NPDC050397 TaxID=3364279 RepID=UPI00384D9F84
MSAAAFNGLFVAEGSSDMPIADIVELMFFDRGVSVHLRKPDFGLLGKVPKDVRSRLLAGEKLSDEAIDFVVVHRDADNAGYDARRREICYAVESLATNPEIVPVIPVRMTEAWLLLDEAAIRLVAGNPRGKADLGLPKPREVESQPDPKSTLASALLRAADVAGRRRDRLAKRFNQNRKQLLERLDRNGPVAQLSSWKQLVADVDSIVEGWASAGIEESVEAVRSVPTQSGHSGRPVRQSMSGVPKSVR